MARVYLFADEAGNFAFNRQGSRYFILGSVAMERCGIGAALLELRRDLALTSDQVLSEFHAAEDRQAVRSRVFDLLAKDSFRVDATILDKTKTVPRLAADRLRFYKEAWYLHFKYVGPRIAGPNDELLVVASSLQVNRRKSVLAGAVREVVEQVLQTSVWSTAFWPSQADPCLQVADYVTWAIQRKYERGDTRSYELIREKIATEFEPFLFGPTTYY